MHIKCKNVIYNASSSVYKTKFNNSLYSVFFSILFVKQKKKKIN